MQTYFPRFFKFILAVIFCLPLSGYASSEIIETSTGKLVRLNADGTYEFLEQFDELGYSSELKQKLIAPIASDNGNIEILGTSPNSLDLNIETFEKLGFSCTPHEQYEGVYSCSEGNMAAEIGWEISHRDIFVKNNGTFVRDTDSDGNLLKEEYRRSFAIRYNCEFYDLCDEPYEEFLKKIYGPAGNSADRKFIICTSDISITCVSALMRGNDLKISSMIAFDPESESAQKMITLDSLLDSNF